MTTKLLQTRAWLRANESCWNCIYAEMNRFEVDGRGIVRSRCLLVPGGRVVDCRWCGQHVRDATLDVNGKKIKNAKKAKKKSSKRAPF